MLNEFLQQIINGLTIGTIYSLMACGLTLIFGVMLVVNFAHGEFYMLGGFLVYQMLAIFRINYAVSLIMSVVIIILFGMIAERTLLKPMRGEGIINTAVVMIGLSIFLQNMALLIWGPTPKRIVSPFSSVPLEIGNFSFTPLQIFTTAVTVLVIISAHLFLRKAKLGKAIRATFSDREAAALVGVDIDLVHSVTFGFGSALAGISGALLGSVFLVFPTMGELPIVKAFVVVIVGGMGNFLGAIFSGLMLGVVESLGAGFISSGYKDALGFIVVILVILYRELGLFRR